MPVTPLIAQHLPHQHRVEPAAAALAPGHRAELVPALAEPLAVGVVQLGRERARADPGGVGLDDAEHEPGGARAEPAAAGDGAADGVRAGDERIGAVIDVEQHALRAFEQDAAAGLRSSLSGARPAGRTAARTGRSRASSSSSRARSTGGSPNPARSASWCAHSRSSCGSSSSRCARSHTRIARRPTLSS